MKLVSDPSIDLKIAKMQERMRWNHPLFEQLRIDRTQLELSDGEGDGEGFTFCVLGDSGSGVHQRDSPQRRVAELMLRTSPTAKFILHTGDVVYLVGSSEQYPANFIRPYRELLVGGDAPGRIRYDSMVFNRPFLPVPGNHDYYDLPIAYGLLSQLLRPLRAAFRYYIDLDVGWHGSDCGDAYARAFLDYLQDVPESALQQHLERHYTAQTATGRGLCYHPGKFTRLPNRYYRFRYGGIDFFALDSNTFNVPLPIPLHGHCVNEPNQKGAAHRQRLLADLDRLQVERDKHLTAIVNLDPDRANQQPPDPRELLDDLLGKVEQIEESIRDLEKQLDPNTASQKIDIEQLEWLEQGLVRSWQDPTVRGRMIYFHHPPYVTETTKWNQGQTLAVRHYLRTVFDRVELQVKQLIERRPLVDLVLCGHAHCFEHLETLETGHADRQIQWVICGGSGFSLRRQRPEGTILQERVNGQLQDVAVSHQFIGKTGHGTDKHRAYSFLEVDVAPGRELKFRLKPHVAAYHQREWEYYTSESGQRSVGDHYL